MGAYGLAVVAAFAVALAVLVSVSPTPTVDASIETRNDDGTYTSTGSDTTGAAQNGDTIYIRNAATGFVLFEIASIGSASASFVHGDASDDGQSLYCSPATTTPTCDVDTVDGGSTVAVKIDDDSGKGAIFVRHTVVATDVTTSDEITVSVAQVPTSLSVKANTSSIDAKGDDATPATAGRTYVDIRLLDENNKGIAAKSITVVSTRALLQSVAAADGTHAATDSRTVTVGALSETVTLTALTGSGSLAGTVTTTTDAGTNDVDTAGYARVVVIGAGSPGISTITVTSGNLTATADIVLHGPVKTLSAELEQGAIEVGGMTRIVVTALDAGGNPVANQNVAVKTQGGVTPPERLATPVGTSNTVNKDGGTVGSLADKGDLPACGDVTAVTADPAADPPVVGVAGSTGTNGSGQCVIQVTAPDNAGTATDAARGTHTITLVASNDGSAGPRGVNEPSVEVQVGGAPSSIESDAPDRIDPSTELTVNVTVSDDEGVRVGRVSIEAIQTAGDGTIITPIAEMTSDGRAKFTYLAPSRPGVAEFLVRTRGANNAVTASLPIIVEIGEEAPVEPPAPEPSDATLSGNAPLMIFSGGSVEDLDAAAQAACPGGAAIWVHDGSSWQVYSTGAPAIANIGFSTAFAGGLDMQAVWVSACEGDGMGDDG
ncbi:MAG: hypothetical protein F4Z28_02950 [Gammaproteobacteria bacterium]|nr:hypothetical protein [Gammaproteobacteria bacterium]